MMIHHPESDTDENTSILIHEQQLKEFLTGNSSLYGQTADKLFGRTLGEKELRDAEASGFDLSQALTSAIEIKKNTHHRPATDELITPTRIRAYLDGELSLAALEGWDAETLYTIAERGYDLIENQRYQEAKILFEGLVAYNPQDPAFHNALGCIYLHLGNPATARTHYEIALKLDPEDLPTRVTYCELLIHLGELQAAQEELCATLTTTDATPTSPWILHAERLLQRLIDRSRNQDSSNRVAHAAP